MKVRIVAFSAKGCETSLKIKEKLDEDVEVWCKTRAEVKDVPKIKGSLDKWTADAFRDCDAIVFIGAIGIAVRHIAPYIKSKDVDPAIVSLDELGKYCIPLLAGHIGGANRLALRIADILGSEPVVTTATDINGKFSVDVFATDNKMRIIRLHEAKIASSRILHDEFIGFACDFPYEGKLPEGLTPADKGEFGICISPDGRKPFDSTLALVPMDVVLGIGCKRDTDPEKLIKFVSEILGQDSISPLRVRGIASIDLKKDEPALHELSKRLDTPLSFYTSEELMSLEGEFSKSEFVKSITSVDCVCERSAVMLGKGTIIRKKTARDGMTLAISKNDLTPRF